MIRGLLPATLVNPDDSVSDCFVSFLAFTELFSSITEGNKFVAMPYYLGKFPLTFQYKNIVLSTVLADKNKELMYVCGTVAAGFSTEDSSLVDSQPRFLKNKDKLPQSHEVTKDFSFGKISFTLWFCGNKITFQSFCRAFRPTLYIEENITITYVSNLTSLKP